PFWGLLIYVCFAIIKPESLWHWSVPKWHYSRIVAIALLIGWTLQGFGTWKLGRAWGIVLALIRYWLWSLLSIPFSLDPSRSMVFVESLTKVVLPFLVGITTIDSLTKIKQLAWTMILSEGYVAFDLNSSFYSGYNRLWEEGFGGMDNNCNAIAPVRCLA